VGVWRLQPRPLLFSYFQFSGHSFPDCPLHASRKYGYKEKSKKKGRKKASSQQELTPNAKRDASLVRTPVVARTKSSDQ